MFLPPFPHHNQIPMRNLGKFVVSSANFILQSFTTNISTFYDIVKKNAEHYHKRGGA